MALVHFGRVRLMYQARMVKMCDESTRVPVTAQMRPWSTPEGRPTPERNDRTMTAAQTKPRRRGWALRNRAGSTDSEWHTYFVGQRVLISHGTRNGQHYGELGTITQLPKHPEPHLAIQRDSVDTVEGPNWLPSPSIIPLRKLIRRELVANRKRNQELTRWLRAHDELGNLIDPSEAAAA